MKSLEEMRQKKERRQRAFAHALAGLIHSLAEQGDTHMESIVGDLADYIHMMDTDGGQRWEEIFKTVGSISAQQASPPKQERASESHWRDLF